MISQRRTKALQTIAVDGRYRAHRITGVQRYAHEIVARLCEADSNSDHNAGLKIDVIEPQSGKGALGHLWEQTILPASCRGRLLWSPSGGGPAFYRRQVVTFHDLFPVEHPEWYGNAYGRWYRFVMTRLALRALHIIAVSEYTKSRLVKLFGRDPDDITVVHNGTTTNCRRVGVDKVEAARAALKLPTPRYVLSLSSLEKRKNLSTMLAAWARVHGSLSKDIWLVLAGPVADVQVYGEQEMPTNLPRVLYTGYVPEEHLAGLYSGASLFLFPSIAEGFGLPLLEAMACGLRSITANTTSLPEVGGAAATYIDPLDAEGLAVEIKRALAGNTSPAEPFLPALERARLFSWDKAAGQTRAVLKTAASLQPQARRLESSVIV